MKECGGCAMCCKSLPIPFPEDIAKPGNQWCKYWTKKTGCKIYSDRPQICRDYYCAWILDDILPDELRPDRCGAIMHYKEGELVVVVSDRNQNAWREGMLGHILDEYPEPFTIYCGGILLCKVGAHDEPN